MLVGVVKETFAGENRVALIPVSLTRLKKAGCEVVIEAGAGLAAGFPDEAYEAKGAQIAKTRDEVFKKAEILVHVRIAGANPQRATEDLSRYRAGQTVIGLTEPLTEVEAAQALAKTGVTAFAMELIPRITRAQSMDALSSMATVAGYKAVLIAATKVPRMFPMLMTAAGTVAPVRALILGCGVAGLQAIATARRLGAIVKGYDVRPATEEQVLSLGAKFVKLEIDTSDSEDKGGYAKAVGTDVLEQQRKKLAEVVAESDVVITTAAVPGGRSPKLVSEEAVKSMSPGSVIVDLAAERGGNCDLTVEGESIEVDHVTIIGPRNVPSSVPYHASQMYARNISNLIAHLVKEGKLELDLDDEITVGCLFAREGDVVEPRMRDRLGLPPLAEPEPEPEDDPEDAANASEDVADDSDEAADASEEVTDASEEVTDDPEDAADDSDDSESNDDEDK